MASFVPTRRRRLRVPFIETLESRIAPASVVLVSGDGPFTLEVDPGDSHLHIKNGVGTEIFDQGQMTGDDLTITGGGASDVFNIDQTAAGSVSFTGTLSVNIAGPIHVNGALLGQTAVALISGVDISTTATTTSGGTLGFQATSGITLNGDLSSADNVSLVAGAGISGPAGISVAPGKTLSLNAGSDINLTGVVVASTALLQTGPHDISLINPGDDFNSVGFTAGGTVSLRDDNGFDLATSHFASFSVQSDGLVTQTGALVGGDLLKFGSGTLALSLDNTLSLTTISSGGVMFSHPHAFGDGPIKLGIATTGNADISLLSSGALVQPILNDIIVTAQPGTGNVTIGASGLPAGGNVTFGGSLTLDHAATLFSASASPGDFSTTVFSGVISGSVGQLSIAGGSTVTLQGNNTFSGNVQLNGTGTTLQLDGLGDSIPDSASVMLGADTTLMLHKTGGTPEAFDGLSGGGTVTTSPDVTLFAQTLMVGSGGASFTFDGAIQNNSAPLTLFKTGAGSAYFTSELTYTGSTIIVGGKFALINSDLGNPIAGSNSITLVGSAVLDVTGLTNGNAPQTLVLGSNQSLSGNGTINGNLAGSGAIMPGSAATPGLLTINGSFTPSGLLFFKVNMPFTTPGSDFDQIVVSDTVNLSGATFFFSGGPLIPPTGLMVKLISSTSANPTVAGNAPGEGGTVFAGAGAFTVSYAGGDGNDLVLTAAMGGISLTPTLAAGKLTITDTLDHANHLLLSRSGANLLITDPLELFTAAPTGGMLLDGSHTLSIPLSKIAKGLVLNTAGGDDMVSLDFTGGNLLPAGGLFLNGGGQDTSNGDQLLITGGSHGTDTYTFTNATDGSIASSTYGKINYTGLEAATNNGAATDVVGNLPTTGSFSALTEGTSMGLLRLSGSGLIGVEFSAPSHSLTVNRGTATDYLYLAGLPDLHGDLTIGAIAKPFGTVSIGGSVNLEGTLNLAATSFTLGDSLSISGSAGTLALGGGTIVGGIGGGLGVTKIAGDDLHFNGPNTYTGETYLQSGPLIVSDPNALQNSTVRIGSSYALQFANSSPSFTLGGLAGTGNLTLANGGGENIFLLVGNNNASTTYSGALSGGDLDKVGSGTLTLTGVNTHDGTYIQSGILQFSNDSALGLAGNPLTMDGGTLHAATTVTTARPIFLSADGTFEANTGKTLTLAGVISGSGNFLIGNVGSVLVTNQSNSNTGTVELGSGAVQTVNGVTITAPEAHGTVMITPGTTPNSIASIDLTATNVAVSLTIKSPKTGTVTVDKIISMDNTPIKSVSLGANVMLGDGVDDGVPDLVINGKLGSLVTSDVNANTIIQIGKGLSYKDTYKNVPNITLRDVLGPGVVIDVTGDGTTAAGVGGGGLGNIVVNSWAAPGLIKTTQGIKSYVVKHGDSHVSLQVDPTHLGAATTANVGLISIPNGQWAGTGMEVEGVVAKFLTAGLAQGSTISAGAFGTVNIKGNYAGQIIATYDPLVGPIVKGKQTITATGNVGSVTIAGDFTGGINADGTVGAVTLTGTARFEGSLRGKSLGNITANSFIGTSATGGPRQTITASASIGNIVAKTGGLTDYLIAAGTELGHDGLLDGVDDSFSSSYLNAKKANTAVSIGSITIKGIVAGTTIAAGIDPGTGGLYGDGDDVIATRPAGFTGKTKIGALWFESVATPSTGFTSTPADAVGNAFEAQAMTSLKFGNGKSIPTNHNYLKTFAMGVPTFIDSGGSSIIVQLLS